MHLCSAFIQSSFKCASYTRIHTLSCDVTSRAYRPEHFGLQRWPKWGSNLRPYDWAAAVVFQNYNANNKHKSLYLELKKFYQASLIRSITVRNLGVDVVQWCSLVSCWVTQTYHCSALQSSIESPALSPDCCCCFNKHLETHSSCASQFTPSLLDFIIILELL